MGIGQSSPIPTLSGMLTLDFPSSLLEEELELTELSFDPFLACAKLVLLGPFRSGLGLFALDFGDTEDLLGN